jgi:hypothetical protein
MTIPWLRRGAKVTAVFALPGDFLVAVHPRNCGKTTGIPKINGDSMRLHRDLMGFDGI